MNRLCGLIGDVEVGFSHARAYKIVEAPNRVRRLVVGVPESNPELLRALVEPLPGPFLILYLLHTPRGEGLPGRYQSEEMQRSEVIAFLARYRKFFTSDGRYDLWVRCIGTSSTLVWDRHDLIHGYGDINAFAEALESLGFLQGEVKDIGAHVHHYRGENDTAATELLKSQNWVRTELRPEDIQ